MLRRLPITKKGLLICGFATWVILFVSCTVVSRPVVAVPHIPGAKFVGSQACARCHTEITRGFHDATHSRVVALGEAVGTKDVSCEACHGPASLHIKAGTRDTILNPRNAPETCLQCHVNTRAEFSLPYTHPVLAGKISCINCHNPHEGEAHAAGAGARSLVTATNATCAQCHPAQSATHVFPHEVMRDGCVACHSPHGSVNDKMLKSRGNAVCYQCHFQPQGSNVAIMHGGVDHSNNVIRGTCWTSGCHEAVHGSNVNSSLRY